MFGPSFGQQSSYNYFPNNGDNNYTRNAWDNSQPGSINGGASRRGYDDYNRGNDKQRSYGNEGIKVSSFFSIRWTNKFYILSFCQII